MQGDLVFQNSPRSRRAKLFATIAFANGGGILWHAKKFISKSGKDNSPSRLRGLISTICSSTIQDAIIYSRVPTGI